MEYGLDKRSNALKIFNTTFIIVWLLVACFHLFGLSGDHLK